MRHIEDFVVCFQYQEDAVRFQVVLRKFSSQQLVSTELLPSSQLGQTQANLVGLPEQPFGTEIQRVTAFASSATGLVAQIQQVEIEHLIEKSDNGVEGCVAH